MRRRRRGRRRGATLRVALVQLHPRFGQTARNCARALAWLSHVRAELVVLPELAFTGYAFRDRAELRALAERPGESATVAALAAWCRERGACVITGFAERAGDRLFNSALVIGARGVVACYRKLHLFAREAEVFDPGDRPPLVTAVRGVKIGTMICFDYAFPEVARTLALAGAEVLAHPSNLVLDYGQRVMQSRCFENGVVGLTANRVGSERRAGALLRFTGGSQVVGPRGELVRRLPRRGEGVLTLTLDLAAARDKWVTPTNHLLNDRRPELYQLGRGARAAGG